MEMNGVTSTQVNDVYTKYNNASAKAEGVKTGEKAAEQGVVYEKAEDTTKKATYSVNKMSAEDRAALVEQLKADQAARKESLVNLVQSMMGKQADSYVIAQGDEDAMWKFIASGKYTVDEETQRQAQEDISEDGYWGVKQTSQRLFDFASALAGDDVDKMKEMQAAVEEGYKLAAKAWGGELPEISKETYDATNKLFEDYYASKEQSNA